MATTISPLILNIQYVLDAGAVRFCVSTKPKELETMLWEIWLQLLARASYSDVVANIPRAHDVNIIQATRQKPWMFYERPSVGHCWQARTHLQIHAKLVTYGFWDELVRVHVVSRISEFYRAQRSCSHP
jgi:hypothetical protein